MRKLFTITLIFLAKFVWGQTADFVDMNATWNVAETYPAATPQNIGFAATTTKTYGFSGDTLINSIAWNQMYYTSDSTFSSSSKLTKAGYVRSQNNRVLFMNTTFKPDTIYNFNFQVGDSVKYDFSYKSSYIFVTNIDSILLSGKYHKRFFFSEPGGPTAFTHLNEIWIEGIGSIHGPLFPASPREFTYEVPDSMKVTCYKINSTQIWSNPYYKNCYTNIILSVHEFHDKEEKVLVFPNPVSSELTIQLPQTTNEEHHISLFDMQGKLIQKKNCKNSNQLAIDTNNLENNMYFLKIESGNRVFKTTFIKQ